MAERALARKQAIIARIREMSTASRWDDCNTPIPSCQDLIDQSRARRIRSGRV